LSEDNLAVEGTGSGPGLDGFASSVAEATLRPDDDDTFVVDVDGYEGPLDLLLVLARVQKVDLTGISILALAEQYLTFVAEARHLRLELAADYLVMAAWLAYLKSRLLLPQDDDEQEPSGEDLAARLAFRLQRLQAMRNVGDRLMARNRLGRDVFARGNPEGIRIIRTSDWQASLYDLLSAYAARRAVNAASSVRFRRLPVWTVRQARRRLERLVGAMDDWSSLDSFLEEMLDDPDMRTSVRASTFSASLEMARRGQIELRQAQAFDPIYIRKSTERASARQQLKSA